MWDFLFLIVAIFVFIIYKIYDSISIMSYEDRYKRSEAGRAELCATKEEMDDAIKHVIFKDERFYEMADELEWVYGEGWENLYVLKPWETRNPNGNVIGEPWVAAVNILLSKEGKILYGHDHYKMAYVDFDVSVKVCKIIERNIRKKHNNVQLLYLHNMKVETIAGRRKPPYQDPEMRNGTMRWDNIYIETPRMKVFNKAIRLWDIED